MKAFVDADILIWHLRGEKKAKDFLVNLRDERKYELCTGAMQRAEVAFFMRPGEKEVTQLFLSLFKTEAVDQEVVDTAAALYRKWYPSHGIDVNDAILVATAMKTGGRIYTLNMKHYPMPEVTIKKAWE